MADESQVRFVAAVHQSHLLTVAAITLKESNTMHGQFEGEELHGDLSSRFLKSNKKKSSALVGTQKEIEKAKVCEKLFSLSVMSYFNMIELARDDQLTLIITKFAGGLCGWIQLYGIC